VHSVFVPPEQSPALEAAQSAWQHFQQIGAEISATNRARLLNSLERDKQLARAKRKQPSKKSK
jgi:hypothetical protein